MLWKTIKKIFFFDDDDQEQKRLDQIKFENIHMAEKRRLEEEQEAKRIRQEEIEKAERIRQAEIERAEREEAERIRQAEIEKEDREKAERIKREEREKEKREEAEGIGREVREKAKRIKREEREKAERIKRVRDEEERIRREEREKAERIKQAEREKVERKKQAEREETERIKREERIKQVREEEERIRRVERLKQEREKAEIQIKEHTFYKQSLKKNLDSIRNNISINIGYKKNKLFVQYCKEEEIYNAIRAIVVLDSILTFLNLSNKITIESLKEYIEEEEKRYKDGRYNFNDDELKLISKINKNKDEIALNRSKINKKICLALIKDDKEMLLSIPAEYYDLELIIIGTGNISPIDRYLRSNFPHLRNTDSFPIEQILDISESFYKSIINDTFGEDFMNSSMENSNFETEINKNSELMNHDATNIEVKIIENKNLDKPKNNNLNIELIEDFDNLWHEVLADYEMHTKEYTFNEKLRFKYDIVDDKLVIKKCSNSEYIGKEFSYSEVGDIFSFMEERSDAKKLDLSREMNKRGYGSDKHILLGTIFQYIWEQFYCNINKKINEEEKEKENIIEKIDSSDLIQDEDNKILLKELEDLCLLLVPEDSLDDDKIKICVTGKFQKDLDRLYKENQISYEKAVNVIDELYGKNYQELIEYLNTKRKVKIKNAGKYIYKFRVDNSKDAHRIICGFGDSRYPNALVLKAYETEHDNQIRTAIRHGDDIAKYKYKRREKDDSFDEFGNEDIYLYTGLGFKPILTLSQETVIKEAEAPVLIKGSAGSGKTLISLEVFDRLIKEDREVHYVTFTDSLLEYARIQYTDNFDGETENFFRLSDYFLSAAGIDSSKGICEFDEFYTWKNDFYKYIDKKRKIDTRKAWICIRGQIKGRSENRALLEKDEFMKFASLEKIDLDEAALIYEIAQDYQKYLEKNNLFDDNDLARLLLQSSHVKKVHSLVIDEIQDFTYIQVKAIIKCAATPDIYYFGDPNQIINPTILDIMEVKSLTDAAFNKAVCQVKTIKGTMRMGNRLMDYVNYLSSLRKEFIGLQDREDDSKDIALRNDDEELWAVLTSEKDNENNLLDIEAANYVVVVYSEKEKKEIIERFENEGKSSPNRIETISSIKGREFKNVVLYNLVSSNLKEFKEMADGLHRRQTFYRMLFNVLYVGSTRARDLLIFFEESNDPIIDVYFKNIQKLNNMHSIRNLLGLDNSIEAWIEDAKDNEKYARYNQAIYSYEKVNKDGSLDIAIKRCELLERYQNTRMLHGVEKISEIGSIANSLSLIGEHERALRLYKEIKDGYNIFVTKLQLESNVSRKEFKDFVENEYFEYIDDLDWSLILNKFMEPRLIEHEHRFNELKDNIIKVV